VDAFRKTYRVKKVYSFDVFDTCMIRRLAVPTALFHEVARKALAARGIPATPSGVEDFVAARIKAQQLAYRQRPAGCEDIDLDKIWRVLAGMMGWPYTENLRQFELEAEEATLTPVASIWERIEALRQQGFRSIFVSDMYLPTDFIQRLLLQHQFAREGDGIYVSSEVGKTKASGNLFHHTLAREDIAPAQLWHTGDHAESDFAVPRRLGIHARLITEPAFTTVEASLLQTHDFSAATRIPGEMRALRLGRRAGESANVAELASQFVAPFTLGFVAWVLQRAKEDGVSRLYFMARDTQLSCKVAQLLSPQFGGIDCRYLHVSRRALSRGLGGALRRGHAVDEARVGRPGPRQHAGQGRSHL
jgi:predicted HAD superfamily hydrolase